MPTYEYVCEECGEHHEKMQKMSDVPLTKCPACGKDSLTKMISAGNFHLKGSGWFKDTPSDPAPSCATGSCPSACGAE